MAKLHDLQEQRGRAVLEMQTLNDKIERNRAITLRTRTSGTAS